MTPVVHCSVGNISLFHIGSFRPSHEIQIRRFHSTERYSRVPSPSRRRLLQPQRAFNLISIYKRSSWSSARRPRTLSAATVGTDVAVEDPNPPPSGETSEESSEDAPATTEASEQAEASTSSTPKAGRNIRKSEMPALNDEDLVPGASFTGKVRSIKPFGVFVDIGAFTEGLVHISRVSDGFVKDISTLFTIGQEVSVRLVEANKETGRISLTMRTGGDYVKPKTEAPKAASGGRNTTATASRGSPRQTRERDDAKSETNYVQGQFLNGTVKSTTRSGSFVTLPDGSEGFLPREEEAVALFTLIGHSALEVGQQVRVKVLNVARGQVTLTMKEGEDDEDDLSSLNTELKQGWSRGTNAFELAFRRNKEISSFLDQREKTKIPDVQEAAVASVGTALDDAVGIEQSSLPETSNAESLAIDSSITEVKETDSTAAVEDSEMSKTESVETASSVVASEDDSTVDNKLTELTASVSSTEAASTESVTTETTEAASAESVTTETTEAASAEPVTTETTEAASAEPVTTETTEAASAESVTTETTEAASAESVTTETTEAASTETVSAVVEESALADEESSANLTTSVSSVAEVPAPLVSEAPSQEIIEDSASVTVEGSTDDLTVEYDSSPSDGVELSSNGAPDSSSDEPNEPEESSVVEQVPVTASSESEDKEPAAVTEEVAASSEKTAEVAAVADEASTTTATISPALVKQLREATGAGMMDCKKALAESGGDIEKAQEFLRKKGLAAADKRAGRATAEGRIGSYIHDNRIGVLIEVNCETDFVSRGDIFKELVDDLAMQVAACPQVQYISLDDVPEEVMKKETELEMQREDLLSKPEQIRSKIVEGRVKKRLGEYALLEQPFIKNDKVTISEWVKQTIATIGENMKVNRFVRYNLGEGLEKRSQDFAAEVAAQTAAKAPPAPPPKDEKAEETTETEEKKPAVAISAALVKQLRDETGAGMMDCKKALAETGGDIQKAQEFLRKKGLSSADKKSSRLTAEGLIGAYIHDNRIGCMIEVNSETDFVARNEKFKELVNDLAMQVVACPQVEYVSMEDIPESVVSKEKEIEMQREDLQSKPENIREKIVEGRISKRLGVLALLEQPFIKDDSKTVKDLVKETIATLGENIKVRRFARYNLGEN
ncbi:polyprotein of EF-Ts, chloroplastic [Oryza brachyantha]|uniref:polyprotein of EF-Ts, chloroplastic n=1 Tax=Oryza brachyantha TaxID=4533 RepID=UPI001ADBC067|nr:polyprotein of EF-Ts, chloroplastic [Oryza brachyantha]